MWHTFTAYAHNYLPVLLPLAAILAYAFVAMVFNDKYPE